MPRYGYSTALSEPPEWAEDPERVGRAHVVGTSFAKRANAAESADFAEVRGLAASLWTGAELIAVNRGEYNRGFAICTKCGHATSEEKDADWPKGLEKHIALDSEKVGCWSKGKRRPCATSVWPRAMPPTFLN